MDGAQLLNGKKLDVGAEMSSVDEETETLSSSWGLLKKPEGRVLGHSIWC